MQDARQRQDAKAAQHPLNAKDLRTKGMDRIGGKSRSDDPPPFPPFSSHAKALQKPPETSRTALEGAWTALEARQD